jgi:two-component sensor histidine kinase
MANLATIEPAIADVFITPQLDLRAAGNPDPYQERLALLDLASTMADHPEELLARFVDLAMEMMGGDSGGISLYEELPAPGVFRWRHLRGAFAAFEGATTPRDFSPCGVTLDENAPVLSQHPERVYDWIAAHNLIVPEVLLVPLHLGGSEPVGTLWIVSDQPGHFHRGHARALSELAKFAAIALRMIETENRLERSLAEQEAITQEMNHRVKNLFAVTSAMIRFSERESGTPREMSEILAGRMQALASAHALVSPNLREVGQVPRATDIGSVIGAILRPHERAGRYELPRLSASGPVIECGDRATNGIALIFHELATNSAKYGALTSEAGRIDVRWQEEDEHAVLTWSEHGGPAVVEEPARHGFGSLLVDRTVTAQFGGSLDYEWRLEGLQLAIRLPMDNLAH